MLRDYHYGIAVDAGSLGSRLQVYRWTDPKASKASGKTSILRSVPEITQEEGWNLKISPGISSFTETPQNLWEDHFKKLAAHAESIIPPDKWSETPIYVLSTAGMRLLPVTQQEAIKAETCRVLQTHTLFYLPDCADFVQTIDGETEGVYGWIGLNYLSETFNNVDPRKEQRSIGFMDMGGASTQIAFVPSKKEISRHQEDLRKVTLRSVNGDVQEWNVFVSTWLGFGANEARKRYLDLLIESAGKRSLSDIGISQSFSEGLDRESVPSAHIKSATTLDFTLSSGAIDSAVSAPSNGVTNEIKREVDEISSEVLYDPCLLQGATITYNSHTFLGTGNYDQCLETMYPLLQKHLPCTDDPCLFNGVHTPHMDFTKDKFVGILEYWYTVHDLFDLGGDYSFQKFNAATKLFCHSDWKEVAGKEFHGRKLSEKTLQDACFKASWIVNILHDGFSLPRLDFETHKEDDSDDESHVPFSSANEINGEELSWTLGKMVLFASSQVAGGVGILPSKIERARGVQFIPGGLADKGNSLRLIFAGLVFCALVYFAVRFAKMPMRLPYKIYKCFPRKALQYLPVAMQSRMGFEEDVDISLEEGLFYEEPVRNAPGLRTRSIMNLNQLGEQDTEPRGFYASPQATKSALFSGDNTSSASLQRSKSSMGFYR
ncbi:hypothetical protein BABINDRAFT_161607 [Babjeviella inositovora NRRL Y-12698]|uniref:Golgi apyrase n=1 Tax=Babjeviella inositovora NRRL Y-12698 TaxID=984486 RepID=A0A1E3QQI1_9ASCO|nr:uncharacterized protein BABINDRAFT_161607 [Babjeviella inositovora NRRL Y-12698]ODQ79943.1 hypothetical protein BABINDRAFT_161607 [Babjeviella inositovora NRRL Y-12698]